MKICVSFSLKSLQQTGNPDAFKVEEINIAVRVMAINCYNYNNNKLLEKLPDKLGMILNRAIHVECASKEMDLIQTCLDITLKKGQINKIFGPTAGFHYTGKWRKTGQVDKGDEIIILFEATGHIIISSVLRRSQTLVTSSIDSKDPTKKTNTTKL